MKKSHIKSLIITVTSIFCLGASAMASSGPRLMFVMINGAMYQITAITGDVTLHNGCKVCMNGTVVSRSGKVTTLHDGDMVTSSGVKMSPTALHGHGG